MAGLVTEELNKFGPFGKYNGCIVVSASSKDFSSGSLGAAGFILSGSTKAGHVNLARGGRIENNGLTAGTVYEIGVASVFSAAQTENIIVLLR